MLSKYDILLFDSDNTLYDHGVHEKTAIFEAFSLYGQKITDEQYLLYKKINDDIWKEFERGIEHPDGPLVERFRRFAEITGMELSPAEINELYIEALSNQCSPFPASFEVCQSLARTHKLYIITNGTESVQLRRFERSPLRPFFKDIFTAAAIGIQKPKKEYFDRVLEKIDCFDRSRAVVIGDSLTSDILGGINAGIDTIWYNPGFNEHPEEICPTYEIHDFKELVIHSR
ncbi:MAG: noncanonical pyrimidine nucleotidase, YjjG family [Ruminococcaceae bacterium]|nr:noncanonical pyrimidine nucleotidase, YjjG family [Oscillospiraceae bacterium]